MIEIERARRRAQQGKLQWGASCDNSPSVAALAGKLASEKSPDHLPKT